MPGSTRHGKQTIKEWFQKRSDIHTILDVGCGSGTYPKLLGDRYEWFGVEIWAPYLDKFDLDNLYKGLIVADYLELDPTWYGKMDCVIFGDVLEHHDKKNDSIKLIKSIVGLTHVVISVPLSDNGKYEGQVHYGNKYEKHRSFWKFEDLEEITNWEIAGKDHNIGVFIR